MNDTARTVVRASAAAMPVIGGPLAVVIEDVWQPRWLRQGREFVEQLADDVEAMGVELYASVDELREALEQPEVSEVFYRAGQIASVASQTATRRRCRAAVLNTIRQPQDAAYNLRFVRLIDELSPAHFALLAFLKDPGGNTAFASRVEDILSGSMSGPLAEVLDYEEGFVQMLSADLSRLGLGEVPSAMMSPQGLLAKRTTDLGDRLLEFVRLPVPDDDTDS